MDRTFSHWEAPGLILPGALSTASSGGRGGLGSHPLGANPLALRVPQRGAQGCSRCLHPAGDATSKAHSAPARRNLEHGGEAALGAVSRETEAGRAASQQLQMAQFTPGQAGQGATSRATSTPHPFPGILSPVPAFLLLTFAEPLAVLGDHEHVTHKGSGTWTVPQQLFHAATNPALLRSLWEGGRR